MYFSAKVCEGIIQMSLALQWIIQDAATTNTARLEEFTADGASALWRHKMEMFSALLALCEGHPLVTSGFPSQRARNKGFGVFFDVRLNKLLNK